VIIVIWRQRYIYLVAIEKEYYGDHPDWKECLSSYIKAEETIGVKELLFVKNYKFKYKGQLIHLAPDRFAVLINLLRDRYTYLHSVGKIDIDKKVDG
tara:strand:+ start:11531 stop:11821 length:291 start_codon:yes stop_codon:yes gene_type:complete